MSVQTEIDRIANEVTTQTDLIGQIAAALEGKAAGGGGGGGGSLETVTITLAAIGPVGCEGMVYYTDGNIQAKSIGLEGQTASVLKNSLIIITNGGSGADTGELTTIGTVTGGHRLCRASESCTVKC